MAPLAWRRKQNLSLREVGARLGVCASSVRHYELGIREAPSSVALAYERISARGVTTEDLHEVRRRFLSVRARNAA